MNEAARSLRVRFGIVVAIAAAIGGLLLAPAADPAFAGPAGDKPDPKVMKLMKVWAKGLGVKCTHCHVAKKFKVATPKKKVAKTCRDKFVEVLGDARGKKIDCKTCHDGDAAFMPEEDRDKYCREHFVEKLRTKDDAKRIDCGACHGEGKPGKIFEDDED